MKKSLLIIAATFAFACGGAPSIEGLHKPCNNGVCASGQTCLTVFTSGTGQPSGSSTCEILCPDLKCPQGYFCATASNLPEKVCHYDDLSKPGFNL